VSLLLRFCIFFLGDYFDVTPRTCERVFEELKEDGLIHITHKTAHPFSEWKIVTLAEENGLCLTREVEFNKWYFPGYSNKKGSRPRCNSSFPVGKSSIFIFKKRYRGHDKLHQCYYRKRKGKPSHEEEKNDELDA
ncbi:unnamed protein product, partial [Brassica rapa]